MEDKTFLFGLPLCQEDNDSLNSWLEKGYHILRVEKPWPNQMFIVIRKEYP